MIVMRTVSDNEFSTRPSFEAEISDIVFYLDLASKQVTPSRSSKACGFNNCNQFTAAHGQPVQAAKECDTGFAACADVHTG